MIVNTNPFGQIAKNLAKWFLLIVVFTTIVGTYIQCLYIGGRWLTGGGTIPR